MAFTNESRERLRLPTGETGQLLRELIGASDQGIRTDVPQRLEICRDICRWYRPRAQPTDMMAWTILGLSQPRSGVRCGQLMARTFSPIPAPYRGPRLHPNDPYDPHVFRIDLALCGLGTAGSRSASMMQGNDGVAPRRDSAVCKKEEQLGRTPSCKRPTRPARMGRSTMCGP